jgi:hypothetical protein
LILQFFQGFCPTGLSIRKTLNVIDDLDTSPEAFGVVVRIPFDYFHTFAKA